MTVITIGPGAILGGSGATTGFTYTDSTGPASGTGNLNAVELWYRTAGGGVKVGCFSGNYWAMTGRTPATIGVVTSGSKQTFTGLSFPVVTGDWLGSYSASGTPEKTGGPHGYYVSGDKTGGAASFSDGGAGTGYSFYAYSVEGGAGVRNKQISIGDRRSKRHRSFFRRNLKLK